MNEEEEISVGAVLCFKDGGEPEVMLMVQNNAFYGRVNKEAVIDIGPKGQMKSGESEKEAGLREIKEETGLDLKFEDGFREETHYEFQDISRRSGQMARIRKTVVFFLAYITEKDINNMKLSQEHIGCRLVKIKDAIAQVRHESQKNVLRVLEHYLKAMDG